MSMLIADCPRCQTRKVTFDVTSANPFENRDGWQLVFEAFATCRVCYRSTIFILARCMSVMIKDPAAMDGFISPQAFEFQGHVSLRNAQSEPPDHTPTRVAAVFEEGAACVSIECWNAAATMFRMCVDIATRDLLPAEPGEGEIEPDGLTKKVRRDLGLRLPWLFSAGRLPADLKGLASCIHQDGNDGAHAGTLKQEDAEDLLDFTEQLLERLYTEPTRIKLAEQRRQARRGKDPRE